MHPKIQEYLDRYKPKSNFSYKNFFTQLPPNLVKSELPYLFNIEAFCLRLLKAKKLNHKICIYSDYDTDAVTATATMYWGLIELGFEADNIATYAPDRFTEGYGMNTEAVDKLSLEYDLIISVDCGINSTEEAEIVAKNNSPLRGTPVGIKPQGIALDPKQVLDLDIERRGVSTNNHADLIITDHHHLKGEVPNCVAVLNPRLSEYYFLNRQKLPKIDLQNYKDLIGGGELQKVENWFKEIAKNLDDYSPENREYLSSSVTGVGVSWFCLVWLAYFLEEVGV